jgi:hypothetical protein
VVVDDQDADRVVAPFRPNVARHTPRPAPAVAQPDASIIPS